MGKFTNLVLIAAATILIVVGVAAQTGTVSMGGSPAHGAVTGSQATAPALRPSAPASSTPAPVNQQPVAAPAAPPQSGGGGGDGGDGGD